MAPPRLRQRAFLRGAPAAAVVLAPVAYFAHVFQIPSGLPFRAGLGDWIDPYFINAVLEGWYGALRHATDPASPPFFFPARGVMGYSHGLILYAPFYLAVRPLLHPFVAYTATLFLVFVTGSIALYVVLRKYLRLTFIEALLLSIFFFTSRNVVSDLSGIWSQRGSVFLLPIVALIGCRLIDARTMRRRLAWAWLCGLTALLMLTQDFNAGALAVVVLALFLLGPLLAVLAEVPRILRAALKPRDPAARNGRQQPGLCWAVLTCLGVAISIAVAIHPIPRVSIAGIRFSAGDPYRTLIPALVAGAWFVVRRWNPRAGADALAASHLPPIGRFLLQHAWPIVAGLLGALLGLLVFLSIYLPTHREHPAFPPEELTRSLQLIATAPWRDPGAFVAALHPYRSFRTFLLAVLVAGAAWIPWFRADRWVRRYSPWLVIVTAVIVLIPLRFQDASIWKLAFAGLPGFAAIRDPKRVVETYELAVPVMVGICLSLQTPRSGFRVAVTLMLPILLALDWNPEVFAYKRPIAIFDSVVERPITIDSSCRSFFIKGASEAYMSRSPHMQALYGVDATFIALDHAIPTLDGYSAWAPLGWDLANPEESRHMQAVDRWIGDNHLAHVCALDIDARTMLPYTPPKSAMSGRSSDADGLLIDD